MAGCQVVLVLPKKAQNAFALHLEHRSVSEGSRREEEGMRHTSIGTSMYSERKFGNILFKSSSSSGKPIALVIHRPVPAILGYSRLRHMLIVSVWTVLNALNAKREKRLRLQTRILQGWKH